MNKKDNNMRTITAVVSTTSVVQIEVPEFSSGYPDSELIEVKNLLIKKAIDNIDSHETKKTITNIIL